MPCAGCLKRRKKIAAAIHAVKKGLAMTKQTYVSETAGIRSGKKTSGIPNNAKVLDIRQ